jgi:hypothetical protein
MWLAEDYHAINTMRAAHVESAAGVGGVYEMQELLKAVYRRGAVQVRGWLFVSAALLRPVGRVQVLHGMHPEISHHPTETGALREIVRRRKSEQA